MRVSVRAFTADGRFWDALAESQSCSDPQKLYTQSNRFRNPYWSLEFRTYWGRRTHGRQGSYNRVGNYIYGGAFNDLDS